MRLVTRCPVAECGTVIAPSHAEPPKDAPTIGRKQPLPPPSAIPATDVLSLAKDRLAALEAELASYEAKRQEAAMLKRMIAAAETVTKSTNGLERTLS